MAILKRVAIRPSKAFSGPFWSDTKSLIERQAVTPIISNFTTAALFGGDPDAVAKWWVEQEPLLNEDEHRDMARVAQFVSVKKGRRDTKHDYLGVIQEMLLSIALEDSELDDQKRNDLRTNPEAIGRQSVSEFIRELGYPRVADLNQDPLRLLAELPLPLYITTSHHDFLEHALSKAAGAKQPVSEILYWDRSLENIISIYDREPDYEPDVNRPLVYHLFGRDKYPESLVLTEDDYLDWLVKLSELPAQVNVSNIQSKARHVPPVVRTALSTHALLILGFGVYTWDFRVLFRGLILGLGGSRSSNTNVPHGICMQLDPKQGNGDVLQHLREHFETYFRKSNFNVFWGDEKQCVTALTGQWKEES
jgi:hypothetical protein